MPRPFVTHIDGKKNPYTFNFIQYIYQMAAAAFEKDDKEKSN